MAQAKTVLFTEEEPIQDAVLDGLKEFSEDIVEDEEITEEDIEQMFTNFEPIKVSEVSTKEATIEVTPLRDFSCSYANTWYYFTKGKPQKVPATMRDFLLQNKVNPKIKDIWT